jgi:hypothetical protein
MSRWEQSVEREQFISEYMWNSYSGWFNLSDYYIDILSYEKTYAMNSMKMYELWREDKLPFQGNDINDWLMKYIQIKDRVVEV